MLANNVCYRLVLLTPVIDAKLSASKLVAIIRICLCGGWSVVGSDCSSANASCNTAYAYVSRHGAYTTAMLLTGNVRVTNFAAPAVPRMLSPIRHIQSSSGRGVFFAEKVGIWMIGRVG